MLKTWCRKFIKKPGLWLQSTVTRRDRLIPLVELLEDRCLMAAVVTVGPNVNMSRLAGAQSEASLAINPTNTNNIVAFSNDLATGPTGGVRFYRSLDGGATWSTRLIGNNDGLGKDACCDTQATFDSFGNLFAVFLDFTDGTSNGRHGINVIRSSDGGATFSLVGTVSTDSSNDQPSIAAAAGQLWVTWHNSAGIQAAGAPVTGVGQVGPFIATQTMPGSVGGNFGNITISPTGQVLLTYQKPDQGAGPSTIFVHQDPDGLGPATFGAAVSTIPTNVGGFRSIPAQPRRTVDAEATLVYDLSSGPHRGRLYLVYTDAPSASSADLDIFVRFSDNNGSTFSSPVRINNDTTTNSQFLPQAAVDPSTGALAVAWYDCRNAGPANNTAQVFAAFSADGGMSFFNNVQIATGTSNSGVQADVNEYGDFYTTDFRNGVFRPIWSDNSNSTADNPDGTLKLLDIYTAKVTLALVPPTITTLTVTPNSLQEGSIATLQGTFTDPGSTGPHTVTINWGDGSAPTTLTVAAGVFTFNAQHQVLNNLPVGTPSGPETIQVLVADQFGVTGQKSAVVQVANVPPQLANLAISSTVFQRRFATLSGTIIDPGPVDTHTVTINWGDGSAPQVIPLGAGVTTFSVPHKFSAAGAATISVTVVDDDNASATASVGINVMSASINVAGADAGTQPLIRVFDSLSGAELFFFSAFDTAFTGGVRVAVGDISGDGFPDIIVGAGPGGGPHVKVFDGRTGQVIPGPLGSFMAFDTSFTGGVFVGSGDVNGDGVDDIIVGADQGGGPHIKIFDGKTGAMLASFMAFDPDFLGGVRVAAGDVEGIGRADVVVGAGPGGGPHVRVYTLVNGAMVPLGGPNGSYFAYDPSFVGGVFVATGDVNGDGKADIITGPGIGGGPNAHVYDGGTGQLIRNFIAFGPEVRNSLVADDILYRSGLRVAATDRNGDGKADILTSPGVGQRPKYRMFDSTSLNILDDFFAFDPNFRGGVFVGGV